MYDTYSSGFNTKQHLTDDILIYNSGGSYIENAAISNKSTRKSR
jgi:hypothetical protein